MQFFKNSTRKESIKKRMVLSIILGVTLIFSSISFAASIVVIGNSKLSLKQLTKKQLASVYLNKSYSLPGNVELTPIDQATNSSAYSNFYQTILGWSADDVSSYWSTQIFSGGANQPSSVNDDASAVSAVENNPNAIAYVSSDSEALDKAGNKVKVLYGHYTPTYLHPRYDPHYHSATSGYINSNSSVGSFQQQPNNNNANNTDNNNQTPTTRPVISSQDDSSNELYSQLASELTSLRDGNKASKNLPQGPGNVWGDIQNNIHINPALLNNSDVQRELNFYLSHRGILNTMLNNSIPYIQYVYSQTRLRHMPAMFTLLPMVESGYDPNAYSKAGAAGLWQMMPVTATGYGLNISWWYDERRDILASTNAALNYLVSLHGDLRSWYLAAAAYDAGEGAIKSAININKNRGESLDYWSLPLSQETRNYVPKLLALTEIIKNAKQYGITLPKVPDQPYFVAFKMNSQLDIAEIARLSGVPKDVISHLNPGFRRWATGPEGDYILLIPAPRANEFQKQLMHISGRQHISWQYHEVHSGETLASIAKNYRTSEDLLRQVNHLQSDQLQPDQGILVPLWLNQTFKKPVGMINLATNSTVASVKPKVNAHVRESIIPNLNTAIPSNITVDDILSGKLADGASHRKQQQEQESSTVESSIPKVQSGIPNQNTQKPIEKNDSLKTLINKLYRQNS